MSALNRQDLDLYLRTITIKGIIPNFYASVPYLEACGAEGVQKDCWSWVEEDGVCLFPPIRLLEDEQISSNSVDFVWSDFENVHMPPDWRSEFLDYEYIFDPMDFDHMNGKDWKVFRKNCRKWPRRHDHNYNYGFDPDADKADVGNLVADWLEGTENPQDAEVMAYLALESDIVHRKYLYAGNTLMGMNVFDVNYWYVNFRYCICRRDEDFLDEFMRYLFYTDPFVRSARRRVNDGGILGRPGLEAFKDKMNPIQKRVVSSWRLNV